MRPEDIRDLPTWEGPKGTVFWFDRDAGEWVFSARDGTEGRVPEEDVVEFVVKCLKHQEQTR